MRKNVAQLRAIFQFPPPRGGERTPAVGIGTISDFNSRPREGANRPQDDLPVKGGISIPAPARGRTDGRTVQLPLIAISIPAPARGRTYSAGRYPPAAYFNSRPREGANSGRWMVWNIVLMISIPAPARGRTCRDKAYRAKKEGFQFPPPRGGERPPPLTAA